MHVRIIGACTGDVIFGDGELKIHIQVVLVKLHRLFGITAPVSHMMKPVSLDGHYFVSKTPRST